MAGLYLHIPFCKQACHYCDFHFSTNLARVDELVDALARELELQKDYLDERELATVYFGGGTPSLLESHHFEKINNSIRKNFVLSADAEVTLEANPDDLTASTLQALRSAGINRLSIGIQSFDDTVLRFLHRAHDSSAALRCIDEARMAGFDNLSIDLIYAIPGQTHERWRSNINTALQLNPNHISAYALTLEEKTVFGSWVRQKKITPVEEEFNAVQFEILMDELEAANYKHYEISNFCKPGFEARHNSSYWKREPYLGVGPSAHSYNQRSRQFNVKNNAAYIKSIQQDILPSEHEHLTRENQINEYLLTSLRTSWGCDADVLKSEFGFNILDEHRTYLKGLAEKELLTIQGNIIRLTRKGKLFADKIAADLFVG